MTTMSIIQYFKDEYDINVARVYVLLREVRRQVGEMYNKTNDKVLEDTITLLESMREDAFKSGNKKLVLEIQKELNKINQLYIEKINMTVDFKAKFPGFNSDN
jgi:hypothetical protein